MSDTHASQSTVLLIETGSDDASTSLPLVEEVGATCHRVDSLEGAEEVLKMHAPDVVVVDYNLPDGTGIDLISLLRQQPNHRSTPIILLTGEIATFELERAVMMGIYAFLAKPFQKPEFAKLVSSAISESAGRVRNDNGK